MSKQCIHRTITYDGLEEKEQVKKLCEFLHDSFQENPRLVTFIATACLRFRHHDYAKAADRLKKYLKWRRQTFGDLADQTLDGNDKLLSQITQSTFTRLSPERLPNGEALLFVNMQAHDPSEFSAEDTINCWHFLVLDAMMQDANLARNGFIVVNDMTGASLSNMDMRFPALIASTVADAMPVRVRNLIVMNPPMVIRFALAITKPLLSSKLSKRINIVNDKEELLEHLRSPMHLLPDALGGELSIDASLSTVETLKARGLLV